MLETKLYNWTVTRLRLSIRNAINGAGVRGDMAGFPLYLLSFPQQLGFLMLRPQITN